MVRESGLPLLKQVEVLLDHKPINKKTCSALSSLLPLQETCPRKGHGNSPLVVQVTNVPDFSTF